MVLDSILALAASHRARQDTTFRATALQLSGGVLHYLSNRMRTTDTTRFALDPETLVITMILCLMGIIHDCDERWVVHLKGARDLIRLRRQALLSAAPQSQSTAELVGFSENSLLTRTSSARRPAARNRSLTATSACPTGPATTQTPGWGAQRSSYPYCARSRS